MPWLLSVVQREPFGDAPRWISLVGVGGVEEPNQAAASDQLGGVICVARFDGTGRVAHELPHLISHSAVEVNPATVLINPISTHLRGAWISFGVGVIAVAVARREPIAIGVSVRTWDDGSRDQIL